MPFCRFQGDGFRCGFHAHETGGGRHPRTAGNRVLWASPESPFTPEALRGTREYPAQLNREYLRQTAEALREYIKLEGAGDSRDFGSSENSGTPCGSTWAGASEAPDWLLPELDREMDKKKGKERER